MENNTEITIGKRKNGIEIIYWVILAAGLGIFVLSKRLYVMAILGVFMIIVAIFILSQYSKTPKEAIKLCSDGNLIFKQNKILISNITDVSYRRAKARRGTYTFGKIIVSVGEKNYEVNFIDDCEAVSKEITRIVYDYKV